MRCTTIHDRANPENPEFFQKVFQATRCYDADALASSDDPRGDGSCDDCSCALVDAFVPPLRDAGFDVAEAGGFAGAEQALRSCISVLALPLARAG